MFVGRAKELAVLEDAYKKDAFQMIVLYGRRRIGKTTLLAQFAKGKRALFFTAQEQSDRDNLTDFTRKVAEFFALPAQVVFDDWDAAFDFLATQAKQHKFLFIFDEFPYAAQAKPALASKLQIAIDHKFKKTNMCMVLCGSNQGFMESDVLGIKSPLHGRRTAQIKLDAFDYLETQEMLGNVDAQQAFLYHSCIGGVPYYLDQVDAAAPFEQNIANLYFDPAGFLFAEPAMLLRQELREPAVYNSILRAIAAGATKQKEIADKTGMPANHLARYLGTLRDLKIVERVLPFGESAQSSRKGIYRIVDPCFRFWYRFVAPMVADIEAGGGALAARAVTESSLDEFLGRAFEELCAAWLMRQALAGALPIEVTSVGSWWGTDSAAKQQTDIDVLAADKVEKRLIIGECKYRNSFDETAEMQKLVAKAGLVKGYTAEHFYFFSKNPMKAASRKKFAAQPNMHLVTLSDIYAH
jgi:AAA+ ATPase superfamily predicted ATPase